MRLRDFAWDWGAWKTGMVSWGLWIGRIGIVVSLLVFEADMLSTKVDLHIVITSAVHWDVCCELSGD